MQGAAILETDAPDKGKGEKTGDFTGTLEPDSLLVDADDLLVEDFAIDRLDPHLGAGNGWERQQEDQVYQKIFFIAHGLIP